jgi:membrane protein implicated in regulation of membrane protease activity
MWFGLAAAVTALIAFAFDVSWQWQFVWFGLLSLASVGAALKYLRKHPPESDRPLLNERAVQHIGQSFSLVDPIVNGRGSVKIGDSIWRVEGPDLPKGTRVRVLGADGSLLKVAPDGAEAA